MIHRTKTISYDGRVRIFWALVGISFLSLVTYIYSINVTARHIAERQELERQIRDTTAELNSLEFAYIDLKNSVTLELAANYGFQEAKNPLYVSRTPSTLTLNTPSR